MRSVKDRMRDRGPEGSEKETESRTDPGRECFRFMYENSLEGMLLAKAETGEVLYANPAALDMLAMTEGEIRQAGRDAIVVPDDVLPRALTERMEHGKWRGELLFRRKGGEIFPVEVSSSLFKGPDGTDMSSLSFREITGRRRAEEALRESEERFRKLFDALPLGVGLIDPKTLEYVMFNEAMARDMGFTVEEFSRIKLSGLEICHDRPTIEENQRRMIQGEKLQFESCFRHKSKGMREVLVTATGLNMDGRGLVLSMVLDITERKRAEEALRTLHESLEERVGERTAELMHEREVVQTIIDNIPVMLTFYRPTGEVAFVNKEVERVLGWKWDELDQVDVMAECYPDPEYRRDVWEFMTNPGPHWKDFTVRTRDGRQVETRWMNVRLSDNAQIGIGLDVTEQLRLEEELRHSQKMEALGTMAGGVAHDFNNILAAVIGFSEMAKEDLPEGSGEKYHLEQVLKAGLRGRDLVKQMLSFSRKTGESRKPIKLSEAIEQALKLIRASIPTTVAIKLDIESESGVVLADITQIQQVMINLCNNAADAMSEDGGVLSITLSDFTVLPGHSVAGLPAGAYIRVRVNDTGKGMTRRVLERVFEPFFSTKEPGKGTGLGLSIVHGIVSSYGGEIVAESIPGKGTTFTIFLPQAQEIVSGEEEETVFAPGGGGERILFVDDEEALVQLASGMMKTLGYRVTAKTSSRETLETFRQDPDAYDLVVSDQTMPGMTGLQLSRELKSIRDVPFILATGYSQAVNEESARQAGVNALVLKPLTKNELARTIRQVLDEKRVRRRRG